MRASTITAAAPQRDQRRKVLMASDRFTGLDSVTVERIQDAADTGGPRWRLWLHFVPAAVPAKSAVPGGITPSRIRILLDGKPASGVRVLEVGPKPVSGTDLQVVVRTDGQEAYGGDPPVLLLELVEVQDVDPLFSSAPVTFRTGEPAARIVPRLFREAALREPAEIDYLAKDYESFRQLMLERMAFHIPQWEERNPADLGVTIIEVLAYAADYLSYYQDAVATEAYLDTARRRISVRRHARMLDYRLDEGTNARVWVQVKIDPLAGEDPAGPPGSGFTLPSGTPLLTLTSRIRGGIEEGGREHRRALEQDALAFQTMAPLTVYPEHHKIDIYTWGAEEYTLSRGATAASLCGHLERLAAGDVLVFETKRAAAAGGGQAAPRGYQAVRLSRPPVLTEDRVTGEKITEAVWFDEDRLLLDFPVSRVVGRVLQKRLSVVRGNIVLADHGATVEDLLEPVPERGSYTPVLSRLDLTFRAPFDAAAARREAAVRATATEQAGWEAAPEVELLEIPPHVQAGSLEEAKRWIKPWQPRWRAQYDLLNSGRFAREFAVEVDDRGRAHLRFGDGQAGRRPPAGTRFLARYRVGAGPRGNIGPHALAHVVVSAGLKAELEKRGLVITGVRNHLPGVGGSRQEPAEHARIYGPDIVISKGFQLRCVTDEDYVVLAESYAEKPRAVVRRQWTGSAHAVLLFVQRRGGLPLDAAFEDRLRRYMEPKLLVGWDLVIREPLYVPLDIQVTVVLEPGLRAEALYQRFSREIMQPGERLFDPDYFTFGDSVYMSRITALIMRVQGVADVRVDVFQRWGRPAGDEMDTGCIAIGPLEIARLDNDPAAPQRGTFKVRIEEG